MLQFLPGRVGQKFETKFLWAQRRVRIGKTQRRFAEALDNLEPGAVCIDLGANVGKISQQLWDKGAKIYAFEPDPWAFQQLNDRFAGKDRITLHNAAIGIEDGTVTLVRDPGFSEGSEHFSQGSSTHRSLLWVKGESETFEVEQMDIRRFLNEIEGPVEIMKVDIEGAEADLLEALLFSPELKKIKRMFVETHEPQMPELRERLREIRARVKSLSGIEIDLDWV